MEAESELNNSKVTVDTIDFEEEDFEEEITVESDEEVVDGNDLPIKRSSRLLSEEDFKPEIIHNTESMKDLKVQEIMTRQHTIRLSIKQEQGKLRRRIEESEKSELEKIVSDHENKRQALKDELEERTKEIIEEELAFREKMKKDLLRIQENFPNNFVSESDFVKYEKETITEDEAKEPKEEKVFLEEEGEVVLAEESEGEGEVEVEVQYIYEDEHGNEIAGEDMHGEEEGEVEYIDIEVETDEDSEEGEIISTTSFTDDKTTYDTIDFET